MLAAGAQETLSISMWFHDGLNFFLKPGERLKQPLTRKIERKSSVKDAIEACGVPHPEVDLILVNQQPVLFGFQLVVDSLLHIYPFSSSHHVSSRLQRRGIKTFVADGHLGKLVRDLRLFGIDVAYRHDADDQDLLAVMRNEARALLTRDRRLLMHRIVENGYFPRSQQPFEQTIETIRRFELLPVLAPFTRCLRCNGLLDRTEKEAVIDRLEPLTKLYYEDFRRCPDCGQTYWRGSHITKLEKRVEQILTQLER
jgi:uncharacterized protein with PIN domain